MPRKKKQDQLRLAFILIALCILLAAGCKGESLQPNQLGSKATTPFQFIDALGREINLPESPKRVVALTASFAETWLLGGGTLVGVTSDAHERETFTLDKETRTIGTIKDPNSEVIIALEPDFIILSQDIPSHLALSSLFTACAIPHAYFHVETMEDYLLMLKICTTLTSNEDLYEKHGLDVQKSIDQTLSQHISKGGTYLLLRSYSTKVRAKGGDVMVARMLSEFGLTNLTDVYPSLLEELSMETIITEDPSYIFVVPMGDERAAKATMEHMLKSNPAFASLEAVQNGRYHLLPKDLFHYKSNNRWGESYAYLAKLLTQ